MESSQLTGDIEECCSSESGWTMYLESPTHDDGEAEDDHGDADDGDDDDDAKNDDSLAIDGSEEGNEDDDSMASDASSGPTHCGNSYKKCDARKVLDHPKHHDADGVEQVNYSQYSSSSYKKKTTNKVEKRRDEGKKSVSHREGSATSLFHGNSKVRKTNLSLK